MPGRIAAAANGTQSKPRSYPSPEHHQSATLWTRTHQDETTPPPRARRAGRHNRETASKAPVWSVFRHIGCGGGPGRPLNWGAAALCHRASERRDFQKSGDAAPVHPPHKSPGRVWSARLDPWISARRHRPGSRRRTPSPQSPHTDRASHLFAACAALRRCRCRRRPHRHREPQQPSRLHARRATPAIPVLAHRPDPQGARPCAPLPPSRRLKPRRFAPRPYCHPADYQRRRLHPERRKRCRVSGSSGPARAWSAHGPHRQTGPGAPPRLSWPCRA